jgi:CheY-like chemotaxis protein
MAFVKEQGNAHPASLPSLKPMSEKIAVKPLALVVDSDAGLRKFNQMLAESVGFYTEAANSGGSAIAMMRALKPAVILLDLQTPGQVGLDVLQEMAARKSSAKIIIFGRDRRGVEIAAEVARRNGLSVAAALQKTVASDRLKSILMEISLEFRLHGALSPVKANAA